MLRKFLGLTAAAAAVAMAPSMASANFQQGDWEVTLSGNAGNGPDFDGVFIGLNGSAGYFVTDAVSLGVRQALNYSDLGPGSTWTGSTAGFVDYHFEVADNIFPYVGANLGYAYGDDVRDTWFAAPEAGVKVFVRDNAFLFGQVEYRFLFRDFQDADNSFSDGQFVYTLGIGLTF